MAKSSKTTRPARAAEAETKAKAKAKAKPKTKPEAKAESEAKAEAPSRAKATPVEARGSARRASGTRAGEAALETAIEGAREMWKAGHLQRAGREVVRGKTDLASALRTLAKPARDLLERTLKEHERVAEEDRPVEGQLAAALREPPGKKGSRTMKRGGKSETVMRGVVRGPDGEPMPGLLVEGRRAGTKATLLAVDVTDDEGRYQLVIANDTLGAVKSANLTLEIGLDRGRALHTPDRTFKVATATATDHDVALPEQDAARARQALARRDELDAARVHALNQRNALLTLEKQQLATLAKGIGQLLGGRSRK